MKDKMNKSLKIERVLVAIMLAFSNLPAFGAWGEQESAYTFGNQGQTLEDIQSRNYGTPKQMASIVPKKPVAAKDKNGNRVYFTPSGKMTMRISKDGKAEFSIKSGSKELDAEGNLTKETANMKGTNRVEVKNEKGELLGYKELGYGSKVVAEYDNEGNLTKSYKYNEYGKSTEWITDELTQTKTIFNENNQPSVDINFEGFEVARYKSDSAGRLQEKEDVYGNKTFFDKSGNMTYSEDFQGNKNAVYHYGKDENGNTVLNKVENPVSGDVTYFENGKQTVTQNNKGAVIKEYTWDGTKLVYTFDSQKGETTYYDTIGRPTYTMNDDVEVMRWIYSKGRMVGQWNQSSNSTMIYKNQRETMTIETGSEPPTALDIQKMIDEGLIDERSV